MESPQARVLTVSLIVLAAWGIALTASGGAFFPGILRYGDFGTHDFVQYWSAFQLLRNGQDPYHPVLLKNMEAAVGWPDDVPLMMWNPPWILLVMAPVLGFSFLTAARLWFVSSLAMLVVAWFVAERTWQRPHRAPAYLRLVLCFVLYPLQQTLFYGQASVLIVIGCALFIDGLVHRKDWELASGALLISIKPHLALFVLALAIAVWVREPRRRPLLLAAVLAGGSAALLTLISPSIWQSWFADPQTKSAIVVPTSLWRSATIPSRLIYDYLPFQVETLGALRAAIPLALTVGYGVWLLRRQTRSIEPRTAARAVTLSILLAPYGWVMDQCVLLIPQILLVQELDERFDGLRFVASVMPIIALNLMYGWYCTNQAQTQQEMFWLPLAFFGLTEVYYWGLGPDSPSIRS